MKPIAMSSESEYSFSEPSFESPEFYNRSGRNIIIKSIFQNGKSFGSKIQFFLKNNMFRFHALCVALSLIFCNMDYRIPIHYYKTVEILWNPNTTRNEHLNYEYRIDSSLNESRSVNQISRIITDEYDQEYISHLNFESIYRDSEEINTPISVFFLVLSVLSAVYLILEFVFHYILQKIIDNWSRRQRFFYCTDFVRSEIIILFFFIIYMISSILLGKDIVLFFGEGYFLTMRDLVTVLFIAEFVYMIFGIHFCIQKLSYSACTHSERILTLFQRFFIVRLCVELTKKLSKGGTLQRTQFSYGFPKISQKLSNRLGHVLKRAHRDFFSDSGSKISNTTREYFYILYSYIFSENKDPSKIISDQFISSRDVAIIKKLENHGFYTLADLEVVFPNRNMLFNISQKAEIPLKQPFSNISFFRNHVNLTSEEFINIKLNVDNISAVTQTLNTILKTNILGIAIATAIAIILGPSQTLMSGVAIVAYLYYYFSNFIIEVFSNYSFIFIEHPFDIGDVIEFEYEDTRTISKVHEMHLFYSVFKKFDGTSLRLPNSTLKTFEILNYRRSTEASFEILLTLNLNNFIRRVDVFKTALQDYLIKNTIYYKPEHYLDFCDVEDLFKVNIKILIKTKKTWQEYETMLELKKKLIEDILQLLEDKGIKIYDKRQIVRFSRNFESMKSQHIKMK